MKSYRKELWFHLHQRMEFVNITANVEEALKESGIREGLCLVKTILSVIPRELSRSNYRVKFVRASPHGHAKGHPSVTLR